MSDDEATIIPLFGKKELEAKVSSCYSCPFSKPSSAHIVHFRIVDMEWVCKAVDDRSLGRSKEPPKRLPLWCPLRLANITIVLLEE